MFIYHNVEERIKYDIKNCLICDSKLIQSETDQAVWYCKNHCFEDHDYFYSIFEEMISAYDRDCEKKLIEKIKYWRENDRYLIKIIGADND